VCASGWITKSRIHRLRPRKRHLSSNSCEQIRHRQRGRTPPSRRSPRVVPVPRSGGGMTSWRWRKGFGRERERELFCSYSYVLKYFILFLNKLPRFRSRRAGSGTAEKLAQDTEDYLRTPHPQLPPLLGRRDSAKLLLPRRRRTAAANAIRWWFDRRAVTQVAHLALPRHQFLDFDDCSSQVLRLIFTLWRSSK
jgi:hypothetical protein